MNGKRLTLCNFDSLCGEKEAAEGYLAVETAGEKASAAGMAQKQRERFSQAYLASGGCLFGAKRGGRCGLLVGDQSEGEVRCGVV